MSFDQSLGVAEVYQSKTYNGLIAFEKDVIKEDMVKGAMFREATVNETVV